MRRSPRAQRLVFRLPPYDTLHMSPRNNPEFHVDRTHAAGDQVANTGGRSVVLTNKHIIIYIIVTVGGSPIMNAFLWPFRPRILRTVLFKENMKNAASKKLTGVWYKWLCLGWFTTTLPNAKAEVGECHESFKFKVNCTYICARCILRACVPML